MSTKCPRSIRYVLSMLNLRLLATSLRTVLENWKQLEMLTHKLTLNLCNEICER